MPKPPTKENKGLSWPNWPSKLRTSSSHQEGCRREWAVSTQRIRGAGSRVDHLDLVRVEWLKGENGKHAMQAIAGSQFSLEADLVLLAMGFTNPVHEGLLERLSVDLDARGNVKAPTEGAKAFHTSVPNVFACGDVRRGQSLVVWAIREGRRAARAVDFHLMGSSDLPG
jgi:glutamate synthase (NADPH/NADH) small chain